MPNYKQPQFFDTLALYFNLYDATERGEQIYTDVPISLEADATLKLRKISDQVYALGPFPFRTDRLRLGCSGRHVTPFPAEFDRSKVGTALRAIPTDRQTYDLEPD
jgi:hypothetical protein